MEKKIGIYCIENMVNEHKYIGQSINLKDRLYGHKTKLKHNKHQNRHLQFAVNKYGIECSYKSIEAENTRQEVQAVDNNNNMLKNSIHRR